MRQNGDGREVNYQKWWTGCLEDMQRVAVLPYSPCLKKTNDASSSSTSQIHGRSGSTEL